MSTRIECSLRLAHRFYRYMNRPINFTLGGEVRKASHTIHNLMSGVEAVVEDQSIVEVNLWDRRCWAVSPISKHGVDDLSHTYRPETITSLRLGLEHHEDALVSRSGLKLTFLPQSPPLSPPLSLPLLSSTPLSNVISGFTAKCPGTAFHHR